MLQSLVRTLRALFHRGYLRSPINDVDSSMIEDEMTMSSDEKPDAPSEPRDQIQPEREKRG